ncbi:hypothetical protein Tco_1243293 [Tanacetum coccineum]
MANLIQDNSALEERLNKHVSRLYNLDNLNILQKVSKAVDEIVTDAVDWALQAPLRARFRELSKADMKEILLQRMWEIGSYKTHEDHKNLYEALEKLMDRDHSDQLQADLVEARKKHRKRSDSPRTPYLEYLRYGNKGSRPALSISKMKAARYPDFGLELLVPEQMWIDEVCTYDISAAYGISHWWFNRQKFYIERHDSPSHRREVRKHIRILSVVRIKAYSRYRYDYLSEILLRRADYKEYTIAEKDFKNLYPSDFEDLNLLLLQGHLDHLPGSDKRMLSTATQLNLTKPGWDAKGFEFKHDYTIIESPRAVVFPVNNNERKIMRFNEIYKFSDGTLTNILEALDYRVKEYKVNRFNPGMNTRFWTAKDVTRSKEFIHAIERRLKTRRIYRNLECFVGGRVRDIDYRLLQRTE